MAILSKLLQVLGFYALITNATSLLPLTEQELTDKLKNYQNISSLKTQFKQTKTFKDLTLKLKSEGTLELSPPTVTWKILKPSYVLVAMDKEKFTIGSGVDKDYSEQTIKISEINSDQKKNLTEMVAWLELNAAKIYAQYEIFKTAENSFLFVPKEKKNNPFKTLTMSMDKKGNLKELLIDEVSGDFLKIEFETPKIVRAK